ncbi:uncharacterized protein LOC129583782 [Paramacrobiotus metropolitanus]|uniref:uncharacterized protein LOC129583782 n=1 Tax=Paramacrobiotus metropolitanus TaxID=2943436 RepID=UPI00244597E7|nr:uncharacterized protein LOC129583782 [Paramacrobiotus metropolitanus]
MQTSVIENVERRLFKNIYGPAVKARQIRIEVGDVYIWRPHQKRRKLSGRVKVKIVRIMEQEKTLSSRYQVEYFKNGDREPPIKTKENSWFFTVLLVNTNELSIYRRRIATQNGVHEERMPEESTIGCLSDIHKDANAVGRGVHEFADTMRAYLKETSCLAKRVQPGLLDGADAEKFFHLLDQGAAAFITETERGKGSKYLEDVLAGINELRDSTGFLYWMSGLFKWEATTSKSPFKIRNILAGQDLYHKESCMRCMETQPDCGHLCCTDSLNELCAKRGMS